MVVILCMILKVTIIGIVRLKMNLENEIELTLRRISRCTKEPRLSQLLIHLDNLEKALFDEAEPKTKENR